MKRILSLCYRRGFLIKRDTAVEGTRDFDYGPSGTALKRNLVDEWWRSVVTSTGNVYPLDSSIISDSRLQENDNFLLSRREKTSEQHLLRSTVCSMRLVEKCIEIFGQSLPFGVAECGRAFGATLKPSEYPLRHEEGEHMGVVFLCQPTEDQQWYYHWQKARLRWWKKLAANPENFSLVETPTSELPGHTLKESFIKYKFPWGPAVVEQISNTGDSQFQRMDDETRARFKIAKGLDGRTYPHRLSLSASVDKGLFAYICDAYSETWRPYGPDHELKQCVVLRLHSCLSPRIVAVLPATDDTRVSTYCRMLTEELRTVGIVSSLSRVGAFPYRLALEDEMGTPYRIIVDEKTLEAGILALQDRDTAAMV
ncbi:DNA polymerase subunit gamma-2, mitochondrial [Geodia barretti]|uniref:DNA polymerase subunit gamma-2, mitochondrial n=1 Tax=Geodia barretti TaxID=519541 RepID=A0AA35S7Q6_GEOBA|nr:DNA polymerase subunit gamma-2, mitochondrial [Geodia barretti]